MGKIAVMVGCHDRPFVDGHWQEDYIRERIQEHFPNKKAEIETVDIMPGGDREGDIFNYDKNQEDPTNFSGMNHNEFDMIFLPDCGGVWFLVQESGRGTEHAEETLVQVLNAPLKMLKPGGYLYFSKILNENNRLSETNLDMMQIFLDSLYPDRDLILSKAPGFFLEGGYQIPYYQIHYMNSKERTTVNLKGYCF